MTRCLVNNIIGDTKGYMGELRINILRQELQRELDRAKELEAQGKSKQAAVHYSRAASIYRKLGFDSPRDRAEDMFDHASQYESKASVMAKPSTYTRAESEEAADSMIVSQKPDTQWEDIGNLDTAKTTLKEAIIIPMIRDKPEFVSSAKTILLYGPPGTGKTLLAKASSNTLSANFFEARASTLLSKYYGESTKLINALFNKAREKQPSLVFMDEIDSIMVSRERDINEATRRVIGQMLTEIEGFNTKKDERVVFIGATNKPWVLDEAMLSRFQNKIYVPLPDLAARRQIFAIHLKGAELDRIKYTSLAEKTDGFSGRDIKNVCQDAINNMVRVENPHMPTLTSKQLDRYSLNYRPLDPADFAKALEKIKSGSSEADMKKYAEWREQFGG